MPVVNSKIEWVIRSQKTNQNKGPLIRVEIAPGMFVKKYREDAIAEGLIKDPKKKTKKPKKNKSLPPSKDKNLPPEKEKKPVSADTISDESAQKADDFKSIKGVGIGAARALESHGIVTFEQLREAGNLDYLTQKVNKSIQAWRESGG